MTKPIRMWPVAFAALAAAFLAVTPITSRAQEEFGKLRVIIEINATDGDAGFQALGDAEAWKEVRIDGPDGRKLFDAKTTGSLRDQGLTEIFFESDEPKCEELPLLDFLARFAEGEYLWTGKTTEGKKLEGVALLTHALPGAPVITGPAEGAVVNSGSPVTIQWTAGVGLGECEPEGNGNELSEPEAIFGYQVVVEREVPAPLVVFAVDLPSTATEVTIPAEFLEEDAIYKFEVVAIEARENDEVERGNQTISESFFCTFNVADCTLPE